MLSMSVSEKLKQGWGDFSGRHPQLRGGTLQPALVPALPCPPAGDDDDSLFARIKESLKQLSPKK